MAAQIDAMVEMVKGQGREEAGDTVINPLSHLGVDRAPNPLSADATPTSNDVGDTNEQDEANAGVDAGRADVEACIAERFARQV